MRKYVSRVMASMTQNAPGMAARKRTGRLARACCEALEQRQLLSNVLWTGTGDGMVVADDQGRSCDTVLAFARQGDKVIGVGYASDDVVVVRLNADSTLDTSFGSGGRLIYDLGAREYASSVAVDSNNRIIIGGNRDYKLLAMRLTPDGALDPTFNDTTNNSISDGTGWATMTFSTSVQGYALALAPDGGVLITGYATNGQIPIARFTSAGMPDNTFGSGGAVLETAGIGQSITALSDGNILVGGYFYNGASSNDFRLVKYAASGTRVTTFGTNGVVTTDVGGNSNDQIFATRVLSDGSIIAAGTSAYNCAVLKYTSSGALDSTWGAGGKAVIDIYGYDAIRDMRILPGDKVLAVGYSSTDFSAIELNANGFLDNGFGTGGTFRASMGNLDQAIAVEVLSDGRLLLGGHVDYDVAFARLSAGGVLDTSYGAGGKLVLPDTALGYDAATSLAVQSDGKLLVGGYAGYGTMLAGANEAFLLERYTQSGQLDSTFGNGGRVLTSFETTVASYSILSSTIFAQAFQVIYQAEDQKIVVAGEVAYNFVVARYNADGSPDSTFGSNGTATFDAGGVEIVRAMVRDANGKYLVAGYTSAGATQGPAGGSNYKYVVARYNSNGSVDTTFGQSGKAIIDVMPGLTSFAYDLTLQGDGKILLAGRTSNDMGVVRLNTNGTLDASFGNAGIVILDVQSSAIDVANSVLVAGGGAGGSERILLAGYSWTDATLVCLQTNGTLDPAFHGTGIARVTGNSGAFTDLQVLPDGRLIGTGTYNGNFMARRFSADGTLDSTFGSNGLLTRDFGSSSDESNASALLPSGDVVLAGRRDRDIAWTTIAASPIGPATTPEGATYTLSGTPGPGTTATITWGDGTAPQQFTGTLPTHIYANGPASYTIQATYTGGGYTFSYSLPITVTNVAPSEIALSNSSVTEGLPSATLVGTLSTTDPGVGDTFTYSLVSGGTDNGSFTISGNTLQTAAVFDYETKSSYSIRVRTTDAGGLWYENTFTIMVTPANVAPVLSGIETTSLAYTENDAATAITSTIAVSDSDSSTLAGATIQITGNYQSGEDVLGFISQNGITGNYNPATGMLTLTGTAEIAYYQAALRAVTYRNSSDNPSTAVRTVSITVNDGSLDSNTVTRQISVTAANDAPPVVVNPPSAGQSTITGTTVDLHILGGYDGPGGEGALVYRWTVQSGPGYVSFSPNGSSAAKNATATFNAPGDYTFAATITNPQTGQSTVGGTVSVSVQATATEIVISPSSASVAYGGQRQFVGTALDQFSGTMSPQPLLDWSVSSPTLGSISSSGLFTAGSSDATGTVRCQVGGVSQTVAVAVSVSGQCVAWGYNYWGQCDVPAGDTYTAIAAGRYHGLALKSDGSLVAWGENTYGECNVPAGNTYTAIAAGELYSLALKSDGSLVAWGVNNYGQCNVPAGNIYTAIAAGWVHGLALKSDGSLVAWGTSAYGECNVPAGNTYTAIAVGWAHGLALKSDGSLVAWGSNAYGQCDVPAGNTYTAIAAGPYHSMALKSDGSVVVWGGYISQCDVPAGNTYTAIAAGYEHDLALKSDGSLVAWGGNTNGECNVPAGNTYTAIAAGVRYSLALARRTLDTLVVQNANNHAQAVTAASGSPKDLYLGQPDTGDAKIDLLAGFDLSGSGNQVRWRIKRSDNALIASGTFAGGTEIADQALPVTDTARNFEVLTWLDANNNSTVDAGEETRTITVHVVKADLQIDSNNDGQITSADDPIENDASKPGKIIPVNDGDADGDGIPDYADGYQGALGSTGGTAGDQFVPIVVQLTGVTLSSGLSAMFSYDAGNPTGVQRTGEGINSIYSLPDSHDLRLWDKGASVARNGESVLAGGDWIPSGATVPLASLGFADDTAQITIWVEAVANSSQPLSISVTLVTSAGTTVSSDTVLVTPVASDVTVVAAGDGQIIISWPTDGSGRPYRILRSDNPWDGFAELATVSADQNVYADTSVDCQSVYYYKAEPVGGTPDTQPTVGCKATAKGPDAPTGLICDASADGTVTLSWTDHSDHEDGFLIMWSSDGSTWSAIASTATNVTTWTDTNALLGDQNIYKVYAFDSQQVSAATQPVTVVPPSVPATQPGPAVYQPHSVYFVARQFEGDTKAQFDASAKQFSANWKGKMGHGFLLITDDNGNPMASYSYHPYVWPTSSTANFFDAVNEIKTSVDANTARLARVWKNDPNDINVDAVNAVGNKVALHQAILISSDAVAVAKLQRYIQAWRNDNGVGYEEGAPRDAHDPSHPTNTIGTDAHLDPQGWATQYWVFGQNCFWWATTMLKDSGIAIAGAAAQQILSYDNQVGAKTMYADNASAKQILANIPQQAESKTKGLLRALENRIIRVTPGVYRGGNDVDILNNARMQPSTQCPDLLLAEGYRQDHKPADSEWQ